MGFGKKVSKNFVGCPEGLRLKVYVNDQNDHYSMPGGYLEGPDLVWQQHKKFLTLKPASFCKICWLPGKAYISSRIKI